MKFSTGLNRCGILCHGWGDSPESQRQPIWRIEDPEKAKTPLEESGAANPAEAEELMTSGKLIIPRTQAASQGENAVFAKWRFCADFSAPSGGLLLAT